MKLTVPLVFVAAVMLLPTALPTWGQEAAALALGATTPVLAEGRDFRGATWGMSEEDVRSTERGRFLAEQKGPLTLIEYSGQLWGRDCRIVYRFVDNLLAGGYYLVEGGELAGEFLALFDRWSQELTRQCGPATFDQVLWPERGAHRSSDLEEALWAGEAHRRVIWDHPPTLITLSLRSVDGPSNLKLILLYESELLKPLAEEALKETARIKQVEGQ